MVLERELTFETLKWLGKIEKEAMEASDEVGKGALVNINAYIQDSKHFLGKKDLMRAFEAIVWAWALLTVHKDLGHIKK